MRFILVILIFNFSLILHGQQNFINVPSSEVTNKHKLFFQQQLNFNELIQSNSTLDYGLGRGYELGINVLGLNFNQKHDFFINNDSTDTDPYNPLIMINGLKHFEFSKHTSIAFGTQLGLNYTDHKRKGKAGLFYANFRFNDFLVKNGSLVFGTYYNTKHYGGQGNRGGAWVGTEVPLTSHLHIMAETVLGNNALCYTSVGTIVYLFNWMPITFGIQIPNTKNNSYSFVFELTIISIK